MMSKPDPLGNAQRRFTELMFVTAAGLSIGVLAGGPPEMSIPASVLAILGDLTCWTEGEKSINAVDTIPLEERGGIQRVGDIVFTKNGPRLG